MPDRTPSTKDRRARRSRRRLFAALMALIEEKPYAGVTVTEIAERADVARATFYLHFDDKEALLLGSFDDMVERIGGERDGFSLDDLRRGVPHPGLVIFEMVAREPTLFRLVLGGGGGAQLHRRFHGYAAEMAARSLAGMGGRPAVPLPILAEAIAGAMLSVLAGWIERDLDRSPEEMAAIFGRLAEPMILSALALDRGGGVRRTR